MAKLPQFQSDDRPFQMMQNYWASLLDPLLANPLTNANVLVLNGSSTIALKNGVTTINHLLSRKMQGWFLIDVDGAATIYRSQPFNEITLTLTSNAAVNVSIGVF